MYKISVRKRASAATATRVLPSSAAAPASAAKVFSFSIFGEYSKEKPEKGFYYEGLAANVLMIRETFPDWRVMIFAGDDVCEEALSWYMQWPHVQVVRTRRRGHINKIFRYFALDYPGVEIVMARDADSRVHARDAWTVLDFLARGDLAGCTVRDNPEHSVAMMGGLCGFRKSVAGINIGALFAQHEPELVAREPADNTDQYFLAKYVYPLLMPKFMAYVLDGCKHLPRLGERILAIPGAPYLPKRPYCGMIESVDEWHIFPPDHADDHDQPEPSDQDQADAHDDDHADDQDQDQDDHEDDQDQDRP